MFGNSPFVSGLWCRFHHTLTSHGYLALSQGFSCERKQHVSCAWRGTACVRGCRGLGRSSRGGPRRNPEQPGRSSSLVHNCLFLTATVSVFQTWIWMSLGWFQKFTPRGLRGYAREHDRWFRGYFVSGWRACYFIHACQWGEWQTGCMMLLDSWVSEQTSKIHQQLL